MGNKHQQSSLCRLVRCTNDPDAACSNHLFHYRLRRRTSVDIDGIENLSQIPFRKQHHFGAVVPELPSDYTSPIWASTPDEWLYNGGPFSSSFSTSSGILLWDEVGTYRLGCVLIFVAYSAPLRSFSLLGLSLWS